MPANSLIFNIFGVDRTATAAIRKVGAEAEATSAKTAAAGSKVATGAAVGIAALAAVSVESAVKYEKGITLLQTAAGESSANLKVVADGILAVSDKTGVSSEHLNEGMFIVEKAMFRGKDGLAVLQAAAEGAVAEGADMGTMTTALTSILSSYHLKAKDAADVTSQMDRAAGLSKTTMQNFAGSLSTVLPIASAAGLSFAQVGGAIATLTAHGTSADEATQELNATIRSLQAPNLVAQKEMNQLGINIADLTGNLGKRGLTGTLDIVVGAMGKLGPGGKVVLDAFKKSGQAGADMQVMLKNMTPSAKALADELLSGKIGMGAYTKTMRTLDVNSGIQAKQFLALKVASGGFNEVLKSGSPATQSAIDALKKMMGGSIGLNTALMLTGENAAPFAERVKEIGSQAAAANGDIATFAETQGTAANMQAKLGAQIHNLGIQIGTALLPAFKSMLEGLSKAVGWLRENWSWVSKLVLVVFSLAVAYKAIAAVVKVVSGVMKVFNLIMLANPIVLVVVAVAALVAGFIYLWNTSKGFRDFFIKLWETIKKAVSGALTAVTHALSAMWGAIKSAWSSIGTFFKNLWGNITGWLSNLWSNLTSAGGKVVSTIVGGISGAWHGIGRFFTGLWNDVTGWLSSVWTSLTGAGARLVQSLTSGISSAWHSIGAWFSGLWNDVTKWLGDIWHLMATSVGGRLIGSIVTGIHDAWHKVAAWFTGMWKSITGWLGPIFTKAYSWAATLVGKISTGIHDAWHYVAAWFTGLWRNITSWVSNIAGNVYNWASGLVGKIASGIHDAWHRIASWFTGLWNNIAGWVGGVAGHVYNWASGVVGKISDGIHDGWHKVAAWFTGLWNDFAGWVSGVAARVYNWAAGLIGEISHGIHDTWNKIAAWFTGLWDAVIGWLGDIFGKAWQWGADLATNILNGIGDLGSAIADKMSVKMPVIGGGVIGDAYNQSNHAKGGPLMPGTFGMVGEDGPETYSVDRNGRATIYSNPSTPGGTRMNSSRGGQGMAGGTTVHVHVNGLVGGTSDGLARQIVDTIRSAERRGAVPKGALA